MARSLPLSSSRYAASGNSFEPLEPRELLSDVAFTAAANYTTGDQPMLIVAADVNNDGRLDLILASRGDDLISVLTGNADGTFAAKADYSTGTGSGPQSVVAADFNSDGKIDLATANSDGNTISVLLNNGSGAFPAHTDYASGGHPISIAAADFSGDGKIDIAVANADDDNVSVFINNGTGGFPTKVNYAVGDYPRWIAAADLNGDGKADLVAANNYAGGISVLRNLGTGTFAAKVDYATGTSPISVAAADLNGDGRLDLAVSNGGPANVSVLVNLGGGAFGAKMDYTTASHPGHVIAADLNGDGKLDLAVAAMFGNCVSVFQNYGGGTFAPKADFTVGLSPSSVAAGDFNGDGRLDLASANSSGTHGASVLINVTPDSREYNDASWAASAVALDAGGAATLAHMTVGSATDADWYSFTAPPGATGNFQVALSDVSGALKAHIGVYASSLGTLADLYGGAYTTLYGPVTEWSASTANQTTSVSFACPASGTTYYVKVSGVSATKGVYTLTFTTTLMSPDANEANETSGAATNISALLISGNGAYTQNGLSIHRAADEDWFRITTSAMADGNLMVRVAASSNHLAGIVTVYQQYTWGMAPVASAVFATYLPGGAGQAVVYNALPSTTYYVRVDNFWNETGGYDLTVSLPLDAVTKDVNESGAGNNLSWLATRLVFNGNDAHPVGLTIHSNSDADWYSFTATANGTATITVANVSGGLYPHIALYNSPSASLADLYGGVYSTLFAPLAAVNAANSNQPATLTYHSLTAWTTYYVKVVGNLDTTGNYSLEVTLT